MKQATLHVDLDSIIYNYRHLKCYYKKDVIAVLKDDAYGVGLIQVAKSLENEENIIIAVSDISEIIKLRNNNYSKELLYLNVFDEEDVEVIKEKDVTVIIDNLKQLEIVKKNNIAFHLKINTGMNRLGLYEKDILKAIELVNNDNDYRITGIMTHFADEDINHKCYSLFEKYINLIKRGNLVIHCFASNTLNEYYENISTHIRVGLKLYGISERCSFLHYALTLNSPILSIKKIKQFEKIGYDFSYETKEDGYLIILPIGYGKGMYRYSDSICYIDNMYLKQAGKISMDYSTYFSKKCIDKNKEIELFGKKVPIEMLLKMNNASAHELLVNLKVDKKYYITKV